MLTNIKNMLLDEEGATMVEYGLIVALIAAVCMAVVGTLGGNVKAAFDGVATKVGANGNGT